MQIISEKTGKEYPSVEACLADEKKFDEAIALEKKKKEELVTARKARAAEVEDAYKAVCDAQRAYREKLDNFIKDYGSFHMTVRTGENNPFNLFDRFFNWF